jgi:membrane associated rhomboid family serine protease
MIPLRALLTRNYTPVMTLLVIAMNVFCFAVELMQPRVIQTYALIPDRLHPYALVTSMFLHGGWMHLIGNMWFLWVFGSHLENALGSVKFLLMYLLCGVLAAVVQVLLNLGSPVPTLGASGAIAGVMGAFLVLYPRVRVVTLVFIIFFITTYDIPAAFMLIYWFAIQLISGLTSVGSFSDAGGVAWFAHVGGFLAGILLIRLFPVTRRRYNYY